MLHQALGNICINCLVFSPPSFFWVGGGDVNYMTKACDQPSECKMLYNLEDPIETKIETIVTEIYGGDGIDISKQAAADIAR